jgi:hypothetical protein
MSDAAMGGRKEAGSDVSSSAADPGAKASKADATVTESGGR